MQADALCVSGLLCVLFDGPVRAGDSVLGGDVEVTKGLAVNS